MEQGFESESINLIAALLCSDDVDLIGHRSAEDERGFRKIVFILNNPERCEALAEEYEKGELMVNVRRFAKSFKRLKGIIFRP
tara:strand:+ start:129 stop:377 length:249 start_codon:yes stop_codon:yes gene_type:complete